MRWGGAFHNSGDRLALGHVNDMRCLEKVYTPANYEDPNSKFHKFIYQDVNHSFMILVANFVLFRYKGPTIHVSN